MTREQFERVVRACARIAGDEIVVIGSQAILGTHPDASGELSYSNELDVYPRNHPERADDIDGAIGEGSVFNDTHLVYAHGVGPETPTAPDGWQERLVRVEVPDGFGGAAVAWCIAPHDLVLSKLAAGREKDVDFARAAVAEHVVSPAGLLAGAAYLPEEARERVRMTLSRIFRELGLPNPGN